MDKEPKKGYKRYCLSLTGDKSHIIDLPLGQGGLSIGTKGVSIGEYDVWVDPGEKINWDTFNEFYIGYGSRRKEEYPYGDWPRGFTYSGMDMGFIAWTSKRRTENFTLDSDRGCTGESGESNEAVFILKFKTLGGGRII